MGFYKKDRIKSRRRLLRVRGKLKKRNNMCCVVVVRSLKHIYAQVIDYEKKQTVVSCSTFSLKNISGTKTQQARIVGIDLAKKMKEKNIKFVKFDRGSSRYHGRVKALSEGLREAGIQI